MRSAGRPIRIGWSSDIAVTAREEITVTRVSVDGGTGHAFLRLKGITAGHLGTFGPASIFSELALFLAAADLAGSEGVQDRRASTMRFVTVWRPLDVSCGLGV